MYLRQLKNNQNQMKTTGAQNSMAILGFKLFIGNHIKVTYKYQQVFILEINTCYIVTWKKNFNTIEHAQIRGITWSNLVWSQKLTSFEKLIFLPIISHPFGLSPLMKYTLLSKLMFSLLIDVHSISYYGLNTLLKKRNLMTA